MNDICVDASATTTVARVTPGSLPRGLSLKQQPTGSSSCVGCLPQRVSSDPEFRKGERDMRLPVPLPLSLPSAGGRDPSRRANYRHIPAECRAWIAWKMDGGLNRVPARLLDIGRGGAAVELDAEIPRDQPLLFGLDESLATHGFLEATVVRIVRTGSNCQRLHLAFAATCPDALLKEAVFGTREKTAAPLLLRLASFLWPFAKNGRLKPFD